MICYTVADNTVRGLFNTIFEAQNFIITHKLHNCYIFEYNLSKNTCEKI